MLFLKCLYFKHCRTDIYTWFYKPSSYIKNRTVKVGLVNYNYSGHLRELRAEKLSTTTLALFCSSLSEALPGRRSITVSMPAPRAAAASVNFRDETVKKNNNRGR